MVNEVEPPITLMVAAPKAGVAATVSVITELAGLPAVGVTVLGTKPAVTPAGNPAALSVTGALK